MKETNIKVNNGINEIFYGNPSKDSYKVVFLGECAISDKSILINEISIGKF